MISTLEKTYAPLEGPTVHRSRCCAFVFFLATVSLVLLGVLKPLEGVVAADVFYAVAILAGLATVASAFVWVQIAADHGSQVAARVDQWRRVFRGEIEEEDFDAKPLKRGN